MLEWLYFIAPEYYSVLENAAAIRHCCLPPLHPNDILMDIVYPIKTSPFRIKTIK